MGENREGEREKRDGLQNEQLIAGVGVHLVRVIHCRITEGEDRENGARGREKNQKKQEERDDKTGQGRDRYEDVYGRRKRKRRGGTEAVPTVVCIFRSNT